MFSLYFSSRPGRPPKRSSSHQIDECSDDKRIKLSSSLLLRSFPDFANQSKKNKFSKFIFFCKLDFKYPVHSNGYLSIPTTNGNQSSSFTHSFGYSAFAPTLPIHFPHNHHHHHYQHHPLPYHLNDTNRTTNYKSSASIATPTPSSSSSHRPLSSSKNHKTKKNSIHIQLVLNQLTYSQVSNYFARKEKKKDRFFLLKI